MTLYDHLIVIVFAGLYPAFDFFYDYPKFKTNVAKNKPRVRIREYQNGIAWIWIFSILAVLIWINNERPFENLGLDISTYWSIWLGLILFILGLAYILYIYYSIKNDANQRSSLRAKLKVSEVSAYVPRTKNDFRWFIILSISAGICEELLFRGFLMWYINEFSSIIIAVILSSVLFGLGHSYQGLKGVLQAGGIGLVMAVVYIFSGSLWIPIALHISVDIYSGMLGWLAFEKSG